MNRIKKGDTIEVIAGDELGARGEVMRVLPKDGRVVISGLNIMIKHQSAQQAGRSQTQGGRVRFEAPMHLSNVMLVCPVCDERTRVGYGEVDGRKVRLCRKCGEAVD